MPFPLSDRRCQVGGAAARRLAALTVSAAIACGGRAVTAADEAPAPATDTPFQTEDISIGEPISLPSAPPLPPPAQARPPVPSAAAPANGTFQLPAAQLPSVVAPSTGAAAIAPPVASGPDAAVEPTALGNGWLGLAVDDTVVIGRLVVVDVAPDGPAAKAGVRPQDMLLAINGNQLQNGDELAAALAAIGPGQRVKMAIGRENRVEDVVAQAAARPPEAVSRDWQQSEPPAVPPPASMAAATLPPAAVPVPSASFSAPAVVIPAVPPAITAPATAPAFGAPSSLPPAPLALAPAPLATSPTPAAVESLPAPRPVPAAPAAPGRTALGVRTVPVDPSVQSRFRLSDSRGAFVIGVVQDLPAARAGVPPGSVIVAINHQPVRSPQDLTQLVTRGPVGTPVPIQYVLPGGQARQAEVVLQALEQPLERALVGDGQPAPVAQPPSLEPAPYDARRVQATTHQTTDADPLARLEDALRRVTGRLEQIERRLERLAPGR